VHLGRKLFWGGTERTLECAFRVGTHLGRYRKNFGVCILAGSSFGEVQKEFWVMNLGWELIWLGTERTFEFAFRLEAHLGRYRKSFGLCI